MTPVDLDAISAAVLAWLLTYAIHSTILLAAAAAIAGRLADEHTWLDAIWKTALLGPLVTASIQIGAGVIPLGGRWPIGSATPIAGAANTPLAPRAETTEKAAPPLQAARVEWSQASGRERPSVQTAASTAASAGVWHRAGRLWPVAAVLSWLAIGVAGLLRFGGRLFRLHRVLGSATPVSAAHLRGMIDELGGAAGTRSPIRLTASASCAVPLALAGRRIVLPEPFLQQLDAEHQRAALAHEIAHVVRRDPAWRILAGALERAFFFQPLNRVARAKLCESAEFLCDQWAVRQTQSPVALARCLSIVASWASPASDRVACGVSAMARSDSALVRRVTSILDGPRPAARRPSVVWLALPLAVVATAAPRVTAAQLSEPPDAARMTAALPRPSGPALHPGLATSGTHATRGGGPTMLPDAGAQTPERPAPRVWTAAELARARARLRIHPSPRPTEPLAERWRWALDEARRQGLGDFWIVYTFNTPTHAQDLMMSDTREGTFVSARGWLTSPEPPLADLLGNTSPAGGTLRPGSGQAGNVAVLMHYGGARADALDRGGYRSSRLGFDFGRTPLFWLGSAPDGESFTRVRELFGQARTEKIQTFLIELASLHPNTDAVLPFLTELVGLTHPMAIRREAAEGFGHQHDPRSVEILLRVARTDPISEVRAEAAETIGEVQTPQSIPALTDLATNSPDSNVRQEAAEAFADQPGELALPAIARLIATSVHEDVRVEAIEALGEIEAPGAVPALVRIVWDDKDVRSQREAVETLGDRHDAAAVAELERIVREHPVEEVQSEAIETLADASDHRLNQLLLDVALSGKTPHLREEALDTLADVAAHTTDAETLDKVQATIERAIFNDPDRDVQKQAIDALDGLPRERALRVLRSVLERHPDRDVREEAREHQRSRRDEDEEAR